jgi:hypothetical protein
MITMAQIDRLRIEANDLLAHIRNKSQFPDMHEYLYSKRYELSILYDKIDELLKQWWAQDCKEIK